MLEGSTKLALSKEKPDGESSENALSAPRFSAVDAGRGRPLGFPFPRGTASPHTLCALGGAPEPGVRLWTTQSEHSIPFGDRQTCRITIHLCVCENLLQQPEEVNATLNTTLNTVPGSGMGL